MTVVIAPNKHTKSSDQNNFLRLLSYLKPFWWAFIFVVIGFAILAATEAFIAKLLQYVTDAINDGDTQKQKYFPLMVIALFVLRGVGAFLGGYFSALIARNLVYVLRIELFNKLLMMPASFYLKTSVGALSSKLIFDVEQVTAASTDALTTLVRDGLTVLVLLSYLIYMNYKLTLVFFFILPPVVFLVRRASKKFTYFAKNIQDSMAEVSHITHEAIGGYQVVKNYGGQEYEAARFKAASQKNLNQGLKTVVVATINTPLVQLFMAIGMSLVVWASLRPEIVSGVSAGEFISYLAAMGLMSKPVRALTDINAKLQRGLSAAKSVFEVLDLPNETDQGEQTPELTGNICINHLSFCYEDGTKAIDDISFSIKSGQTVAIVGRSGSGKSTLVNLLVGNQALKSGQILLDGIDINKIKLSALRAQIAIVNQQIMLFNDTVLNNIAYGQLAKCTKSDVISAAKKAFAHDFISKLPQGYDTIIGADGLQLSGGQRQRLSIARALLKNAPILIMDEATSALDNESEFYIQKALENAAKHYTTIIIAHRLSTIKNADQIIVMDGGKIIQTGTHDALVATDGLYKNMYEQNFSDGVDVDLPNKQAY